jgi:hypothetical protein
MKKWTIAFVNYKTAVYLQWQLKSFYEFNNPKDFEIIIVDNSSPFEKDYLENLVIPYNTQYSNIKIIYYTPISKSASVQHGEALTLALRAASGKYFLANDPDFFWVKKNILIWLEDLLKTGIVAVGAPYTKGVGLGNKSFPCAYGSAYHKDLIKELDFFALDPKEHMNKSLSLYPNYEYSFDVGYKIRQTLSDEDNDKNFISFKNKLELNLALKIGLHSYEIITQKYLFRNDVVAFHLFRGSFTSPSVNYADSNNDISLSIYSSRDKLGEYFYKFLSTGKSPFVFNIKYLLNLAYVVKILAAKKLHVIFKRSK